MYLALGNVVYIKYLWLVISLGKLFFQFDEFPIKVGKG